MGRVDGAGAPPAPGPSGEPSTPGPDPYPRTSRARTAALGTGVWLVAVASVASLSWVVIDAAGHQVGARSSEPSALGIPAEIVGTPGKPSPPTTVTVTSRPTVTSSARPRVTRTTRPVRTPTRTRRSVRRTIPPWPTYRWTMSPMPSPPRTVVTTMTPATVSRTTQGGTLTLSCLHEAIFHWSAQPADGWTAQWHSTRSDSIEVEFEREGRDNDLHLYGACRDEGPQIRVWD